MSTQPVGNLSHQSESPHRLVVHQLRNQAWQSAVQRRTQPAIQRVTERKFRFDRVHEARARINVGLDGVRFDQALAEAVDGRAGDLIEVLARTGQRLALFVREPVRERRAQFARDAVG